MRRFRWNEPVYDCADSYADDVTLEWTEKDIEEKFLPYYKIQMAKVGKLDQATLENAIEDFCTIYWAWEVTSPDAP